MIPFDFDPDVWSISFPKPKNTLQTFITNRCDRRCRGCFYDARLGSGDIPLSQYKEIVDEQDGRIQKVMMLGGEPTLHGDLGEMVAYNESKGLTTTVYTNGVDVARLNDIYDSHPSLTIRIGVLGLEDSEKPLRGVVAPRNGFVVYMMRQDNIGGVLPTASFAKNELGVEDFMISTIRDIATTGDFWLDTDETIPMDEYAIIAQSIARIVGGDPLFPKRLHISRRGMFYGPFEQDTCRFLNVFPDGTRIICPFDISLDIRHEGEFEFGTRPCDKSAEGCILQKLVLESKV